MAPSIANFHHIEIDNIGKRRRNLRPPGGESSDIFNFRKQTVVTQPRKVKFHNRSNIFTQESPPTNSRLPVLSIDPKFSTKQRLFGPPDEIPRKAIDRMKSSIFAKDPESVTKPKTINVKPGKDRRNPITGEECAIIKHVRRHQIQKKKSNPITGEGYESPDEDGSTMRSNSSSSRSDTSYKETISAQPTSPESHSDGKETVSAKPNSPRSHIYRKKPNPSGSNRPKSHTYAKERISTRPSSPRSYNYDKERMSTRPSSPRSRDYDKERMSTRPSSPRSRDYDKERMSIRPSSSRSRDYDRELMSTLPSSPRNHDHDKGISVESGIPGIHSAYNDEEVSAVSGKEVVLYNKL